MKPFLWKAAGAIAAILVALPVEANGQPYFHAETSIESMILNADALMVGKIVAIKEDKNACELTLAVEETLRGPHRQSRTIRVEDHKWRKNAAQWKRAAHRLLIAVEEQPRQRVRGLIDLTDSELQVWKADLTPLRKAEDVLRVARETLRRAPGVKRIDTFALTIPLPGGYFEWGGNTFVAVPVDDRLEKRAQAYLHAKARWKREEGARALRYFKSKENIVRVQALLHDPEPRIVRTAEENNGIEECVYTVRREAFGTLQYWGVNAVRPVLGEAVAKFDRVRSLRLVDVKLTVARVKDLDRFKNMEEVDLSGATINKAALAELTRFTKLRIIHLDRTGITDAALKHLARFPHLEKLSLEDTPITDAGLKELKGLKKLAILVVMNTRVTDAGVKELASWKSLHALYLSGEQVTDRSLRALHALGRLHVLGRALAKRRPGQRGYENNPRAGSEKEIYALDLSKTQITDAGLKELTSLTNVRNLNLEQTRVTAAGIDQLRRALPKCKIAH